MDSVIASARGTRPNNSAQSPPQPRRELETSKRLLQDAKMTRLVSRLIAAKDQAVEKDEGEREQRAREMQQIRELRDVIAGFKEWDRTVLEGRMRELELELALEEMDMRGEE